MRAIEKARLSALSFELPVITIAGKNYFEAKNSRTGQSVYADLFPALPELKGSLVTLFDNKSGLAAQANIVPVPNYSYEELHFDDLRPILDSHTRYCHTDKIFADSLSAGDSLIIDTRTTNPSIQLSSILQKAFTDTNYDVAKRVTPQQMTLNGQSITVFETIPR